MNRFKEAISVCDDIEIGGLTDLPTFWKEHGKTVFEALEIAQNVVVTTDDDKKKALEWFNRGNWNPNVPEIKTIRALLQEGK